MSIQLIFPFTTIGDYTFDTSKVEVTGGVAKLKYQNDTGKIFQQEFFSSSGFTFDAAKTEFTGGVAQQKNQRPANATFGATFTSDINGNWGNGTLTGTGTGGAAILSGKLDLAHSDVRYVTYSGTSNSNFAQIITVRWKYTPNYSGTPASNQWIFDSYKTTANDQSSWAFYHNTSNQWFCRICDAAGGYIMTDYFVPTTAMVAGTEYEMELNLDFTAGTKAQRFFINGVQQGTAFTYTGTRDTSAAYFRIGCSHGGSATSNYKIDDIEVFSTIQHTSNYTPGYTAPEADYLGDIITCPTHTYTGAGSIQAWTAWTDIDTNSPRYILNGKYWSGSAWVTSSDTWATASPSADIIANIASLPASNSIVVKVVWNTANIQQIADAFTITYTGQIYPTDNPTIEGASSWKCEALDGFIETKTVTGSDMVKYILKKGTSWYYWNTTAWVVSNGTYAQANTAADIETNKASFTLVDATCKFKAFLHSEDGLTTPQLSELEVDYNFSGETQDTVNKCIVWGYNKDSEGNALTDAVKIELNVPVAQYKTNVVIEREEVSVTPDSNGYWEIELVENENMQASARYIFEINGRKYTRAVPDEETACFWELTA